MVLVNPDYRVNVLGKEKIRSLSVLCILASNFYVNMELFYNWELVIEMAQELKPKASMI